MKKNRFRSVVLPAILIPVGGLIMMALTFVVYALLYNLLERSFFPNDPQSFPADIFRRVFAVILVLLYLLLLRTRLPELVKAILLTGPLAAATITLGFMQYQNPIISVMIMVLAGAICAVLLKLTKRPWTYYYAAAVAVVVAIFYAYPR